MCDQLLYLLILPDITPHISNPTMKEKQQKQIIPGKKINSVFLFAWFFSRILFVSYAPIQTISMGRNPTASQVTADSHNCMGSIAFGFSIISTRKTMITLKTAVINVPVPHNIFVKSFSKFISHSFQGHSPCHTPFSYCCQKTHKALLCGMIPPFHALSRLPP